MSNAKDTQEIGWYDEVLPTHFKKARKEQERSNQDKRDEDSDKKDLKFSV